MNTCKLKIHFNSCPTLSKFSSGPSALASCYWQMTSFLISVRSLRSLISKSHKFLSISFRLLHRSTHFSTWKLLCIVLPSALLQFSRRDGVLHFLPFFFLLDSVPLSLLSFLPSQLIDQLIISPQLYHLLTVRPCLFLPTCFGDPILTLTLDSS